MIITPLSDLVEFYNGKTPNKDKDGQFALYGSNGRIGWSKSFNHENAIILGRVGAYCGSVEICQNKFWASDNTIVVKVKENNDLRYIYYRLFSYPLRSYAGGAAQPLLTQTILRGIKINVEKDFHTQQKIASVLSAYDDMIENNLRRIALLEKSARLLYKEWFVKLHFPGHEHTPIVDGVPEGWEVKTVPQIISINPKEKIDKGKEVWTVPMSCLSESSTMISFDLMERKTKHNGAKFKNGDVLFPRITPCLENGKTALVQFLDNGEIACGSTEYIVLRGDKVSPEFTYCLARTYNFRENAIKSMIGSSGRQRVQISCFSEYSVLIPPQPLLKQFDQFATPNFLQIKILQLQNQKLKQARDLLLPRLMNGEIPA